MRLIYTIATLALLTTNAFSEQGNSNGIIKGKVQEEQAGEATPVPFANVYLLGTNNGAITDFDGNFELTVVGDEGTLSISYLGYTTQTYVYELSDGVLVLEVITLEPDPNALSEVVVIGTGVVQLAAIYWS